jgi:hypothetical protein
MSEYRLLLWVLVATVCVPCVQQLQRSADVHVLMADVGLAAIARVPHIQQ